MTKNPLINALAASGYILLVVTVFNLLSRFAPKPDNTFLAPLVFLSLFTFSVATMGYLFGFQPLQLYLDGKKKQATTLFVHTLLIFGGFTLGLILILVSGVFPTR